MSNELVQIWGKYPGILLREDIGGFCESDMPRRVTVSYSVNVKEDVLSSIEIDLTRSSLNYHKPIIHGFSINWCKCVNSWPNCCWHKLFDSGYIFVREEFTVMDSLRFKPVNYDHFVMNKRPSWDRTKNE